MQTLRRLYRINRLILHVLRGIALLLFKVETDPARLGHRDWHIVCGWMTTLCRLLGLRIMATGEAAMPPVLFVANHISWHDIVVLQSLVPTGFVAKYEIRGWPLIGWMAHRGATLFIRRGRRESLLQLREAIASRLQARQSLLIFPEGTTTAGNTVNHFRTRLLEPAIELALPVQPVAIHYSCDGKLCENLAFVGNESFLSHAWRLLGEKHIDVFVHFCRPIDTRSMERRKLGRIAQAEIVQALRGRLNPPGRVFNGSIE